MEIYGTKQEIDRSLKNFIRGLTQEDITERYRSYKALFRLGPAVIPQVRKAIFKSKWSNIKYPNEIRYVTGLVSLIHDLDESESEKIRDELERGGCDASIARILKSIGGFNVANFYQYELRGLRIFEHRLLISKQNVRSKLESWLECLPLEELREIERIYVVRDEDLEALGSYRPVLCCITLAWNNPYSWWNFRSWFCNFEIERTLYHEVGHHVNRHSWGQDPDQEEEAEGFANRTMAQRSNHLLFKLGRLFIARSN